MELQNSQQICFSELDHGERDSSFPAASIPLSFSGEIPAEETETAPTGRPNSKAPFFYSALFHLLIFSLLLGVMYQPDKRPIREVNYWVVNLVTALKEEPKGPKAVAKENQKLLNGAILPTPVKSAP